MAVEGEIAGLAVRFDIFARSKLASLYDAKRVVLFIFATGASKRRPAIAIDVDGQFWIRQHPSTGEIDDVEIEDFERVFLDKHDQLRPAWQSAKKGQDREANRLFISQLTALLRGSIKD